MSAIYVGVDPGTGGAIAVIGERETMIMAMPRYIQDLANAIKMIERSADYVHWAMEQLPACVGDGTSVNGAQMGVLHKNAGRIEGLILGITGIPAQMYAPQSWQHPLKPELPRKKSLPEKNRQTLWKKALRDCAERRFPGLKIPVYAADAVLIAYHHKQKTQTP
jgi:hypothetical protein